jgi:hypothetical protein
VFQFLWRSFLKNPHLGITFKYLWPMGSSRNLIAEIFSRWMPVHVKAFGPERTLGNIIDLSLKSNVNRFSIFSIKSY